MIFTIFSHFQVLANVCSKKYGDKKSPMQIVHKLAFFGKKWKNGHILKKTFT
jgi:hypothetical protein